MALGCDYRNSELKLFYIKKMPTKRLFIAINLPMELKRELANVEKEVNSAFPEEIANAGLFKWVEIENLHLTLKFIGEKGDSQIPKIVENIENIVKKHKAFEIKAERICYDAEKMPPRLIWLETARNRELESLAKDLGAEKNFIGHITLARIKAWFFKQIDQEEQPNIARDFPAQIPVNSIELMESVLKKTGPEYIVLQSFKLNK